MTPIMRIKHLRKTQKENPPNLFLSLGTEKLSSLIKIWKRVSTDIEKKDIDVACT